jgi:hypothetical protein
MKGKNCILTGVVLTQENDSKAHIIPSALGGRLKPKGILSREANELLNDKIDLPLIQSLEGIMSLLGGMRDRGKNKTIRMTDEAGVNYEFKFGEPPRLTDPEINMEETREGATVIEIKARNTKEARTLLGKVKAKYPEFDVEEALQHAVVNKKLPAGMLGAELEMGPRRIFPAAFAISSIFSAYHGMDAHPKLKEYLDTFDIENPEMPPDTFYWISLPQWFNVKGEVTHILALMGDPKKNQLLAYVELFNLISVVVILPFNGETKVRHSHAVDVLTGEIIDVAIDEDVFTEIIWEETHHLGDEDLFQIIRERFGRLMNIAKKRENEQEINCIISEAWGPPDERKLTEEDINSLKNKLMQFITSQIKR